MKQLIINNRYFLLPYLLYLAVFLVFAFSYTKTEMHIWANQIHSPFFDLFFSYATHLGDGTMIAILFVVFLFVKYRYAIAFLIGSLLTSGVVHLFKKLLLEEVYRPSKYFELYETFQLHIIEGVTMRSLQSFPSGHTSTAFNVFLMLALISKNHYLKLALFAMALIVAYSRVYLSQHFFIDLAAGSLIAVLLTVISYYQVLKWNREWLETSVLTKAYRVKNE
jgi:membrane-associated phospholipid phosphatase